MAKQRRTIKVESPLLTDVPIQEVDADTGKIVKIYKNALEAKKAFEVVSGGDETPQTVSAGKTIATVAPSVATSAILGGSIAGPLGAGVGAIIGGAISGVQIAAANSEMYNNWMNQERKRELALTPTVDERTGKKVLQIDYSKMSIGNTLSGEAVKEAQAIPETGTPVRWGDDGHLKIAVAPLYSLTDEYKSIVKDIKENFNNLTKENDTDGKIVSTLNNYVKGKQSDYFYNKQAAAKFEVAYPGASAEAIETAISNQKVGYYTKDDLDSTYTVTTLQPTGEYQNMTAKELFDSIKEMDEYNKNAFLDKLYTQISDPTLDENKRAVAQGELNAIYAANEREDSAYTDMISKNFWNYATTNPMLLGFSVSDIAGIFGDNLRRDYFVDNGGWEVTATLFTTPLNILSSVSTMNAIEKGLRAMPGLRNLSAIAPAGSTLYTPSQMAISLGFNASADAIYDLVKMGVSSIINREYNYGEEYLQDLALDIVITYAGSAAFKNALYRRGIKKLPETQAAVYDSDGNLISIAEVYGGTKTTEAESITAQEADIVDVAKAVDDNITDLAVVKANEVAKKVSEIYSDLNSNNAIRKTIETVFDKNIAIKNIAYNATALNGDTGLIQKVSNYAQTSYAREATERQEYYRIVPEAKDHWKALSPKLKAVLNYSGKRKLTDAQNNYLISKQMLSRISQEQKGATLKRAEEFYKPWLNAVDEEEKELLDSLYDQLAVSASDPLKYELARGVISSDRADFIKRYKNWFPVYESKESKKARKGEMTYAISQDRIANKKYDDKEIVISPVGFMSPFESVQKYTADAIAKGAYNETKANILEVIKNNPTTYAYEVRSDETTKDIDSMAAPEIIKQYKVPKKVSDKLRKAADTESGYKKAITKILDGSGMPEYIEKYFSATEKLDAAEGDPLAPAKPGDYSNLATRRESFISDMETGMEMALAEANARNNKGYKISEGKALYKFMGELKDGLDGFNQNDITALVTDTIMDATPYVHFNDLLTSWVRQHSKIYREEILSKEEIKSGLSAYNIETGEEVKRASGYKVQVYVGGEKQDVYISGDGAEEIANILNSKLQPKQQNIVLRVVGNALHGFARIKRMNITGYDWTRVLPNLTRDMVSRGYISTGGDILVSPNKVLKWVVDSYGLNEKQAKELYAAIDQATALNRQSTLEQTINNVGRISQKEIVRLAKMPEAPKAGALAEMSNLKRFGASSKYMFNTFTFNLRHGKIGEALATPGDFAEAYTRNRISKISYAIKMAERIEQGASMEDAMKDAFEAAAWAGRTATTNFGTKGVVTEWLARFTPYSYSSFSSAASMAEAFAVDPVGVGSKLIGFAMAYLLSIAITLSDEESRKNYYNLTDYDRSNNIIIPIDSGAIITIPLDDWVAGFLAPYRTIVETLNGMHPEAFWAIFGAFLDQGSVDLSGFTEGDKLNLKRGLEKLIDTYAPGAAVTVGEIVSGYDLYYGESNEVTLDYLTSRGLAANSPGDYTTTGKNSKTLYFLSNLLGIPQWRIQSVVSSVGNTAEYLVYVLDKLQGATDAETGGKEFKNAIFKSFTGMDSTNVSSQFYDGMDILNEKKAKLINQLNANLTEQKTATGDRLTQLKVEYQTKLEDFVQDTAEWVNQYLSAYELTGGLTKSQATQIFYLFDFAPDATNLFAQDTIGYEDASDTLNQYRKQATHLSAGILDNATVTQFGTLYKNSDGEWEYSTSYGEQDYKNAVNSRNAEALVKIKSAADRANISDEYYDTIKPLADKYYASKDYDALNELYAEWDVKVVKTIAPVIDQYGEEVLNASKVIDYLDDFIRVPSEYEVNNRGYYFSASRLNKQRGFAQSYTKYLYNKMKGNN